VATSKADRYNSAASLLNPLMPQLTWEQVVEYALLADFDILRDTRTEIQSRLWTCPAYRLAMDRYFKILCAREEIRRLNVEIPCVVRTAKQSKIMYQVNLQVNPTTTQGLYSSRICGTHPVFLSAIAVGDRQGKNLAQLDQ
jgi:hypothetical protein